MEDIKKSFSHFTKNIRSRIMCAMTNAFTLAEGATHVAMLKNVRRCAFTLAEVLITLGIIGVVAALTLPTLIQNHQKQVYVTGLKKAYSNLSNAFNKMAFDEGVTEWKELSCVDVYLFDCSSEAQEVNAEQCAAQLLKQFNVVSTEAGKLSYSGGPNGIETNLKSLTTADGIKYQFDVGDSDNAYSDGCAHYALSDIVVDVNGDKGPDKYGRDRFYFKVNYSKNKITPFGYESINNYNNRCTTSKVDKGGDHNFDAMTCTAKVLIEGKMNY